MEIQALALTLNQPKNLQFINSLTSSLENVEKSISSVPKSPKIVSFGDTDEFNEVNDATMDIDTESLQKNTDISIKYKFIKGYRHTGKIGNANFDAMVSLFGNHYQGYYAGKKFDFKGFESPLVGQMYKGSIANNKQFTFFCMGEYPNFSLVGEYDKKPIHLKFNVTPELSHIKGRIGESQLDLIIKDKAAQKETIGTIDNVKFKFDSGESYVMGGAEKEHDLLPLLYALKDSNGKKPLCEHVSSDDYDIFPGSDADSNPFL